MMLMSTLRAELARLDSQMSKLQRARFAALSRCDLASANRAYMEFCALKNERKLLIHGPEMFLPATDEN